MAAAPACLCIRQGSTKRLRLSGITTELRQDAHYRSRHQGSAGDHDAMKPDLILIANASEARLLSRDSATATLQALDSVHRPEDGPTAPMGGEPRRVPPEPGMPPAPRRRRMRAFAAVVARRVEAQLASGRFAALALFAACPFLGELMRQLGRPTKEAMRAVVDADISDLEWTETAQRIEMELRAAAQEARQSGRGRKPRAGG
jgi:protein required for attachment to host cells